MYAEANRIIVKKRVERIGEKAKGRGMGIQNDSPAEHLAAFLNYVDWCAAEYKSAYDAVNHEDRRLQDLVHEMEFAADKAERNRVATKLQQSRRIRRKNKDIVMKYELLVRFFEEQANRTTLNKLVQLLGRQRKQEEYLKSERTYKTRV